METKSSVRFRKDIAPGATGPRTLYHVDTTGLEGMGAKATYVGSVTRKGDEWAGTMALTGVIVTGRTRAIVAAAMVAEMDKVQSAPTAPVASKAKPATVAPVAFKSPHTALPPTAPTVDTVTGAGRLRHFFHSAYSAAIVILFSCDDAAATAVRVLGAGWKRHATHSAAIAWTGDSGALRAVKITLAKYGADASKVDSLAKSVDFGEPFAVTIPVDADKPAGNGGGALAMLLAFGLAFIMAATVGACAAPKPSVGNIYSATQSDPQLDAARAASAAIREARMMDSDDGDDTRGAAEDCTRTATPDDLDESETADAANFDAVERAVAGQACVRPMDDGGNGDDDWTLARVHAYCAGNNVAADDREMCIAHRSGDCSCYESSPRIVPVCYTAAELETALIEQEEDFDGVDPDEVTLSPRVVSTTDEETDRVAAATASRRNRMTISADKASRRDKPLRAKHAPGVRAETIAAACPTAFRVLDDGNAWRFVCSATHTEVLVLKSTNDGGLTGTTAGHSVYTWVR